ncbi:MAG: hypothetical protein AAF664_10200, partial [Planctomycetota bacterium]
SQRQAKLNINLKGLSPGMQQIRIVTVADDANHSRESEGGWLQFGDASQRVNITVDGTTAQIESPGASQIELRHHLETIDTKTADSWTVDLTQYDLGKGPVRIRAKATFGKVDAFSQDAVVTIN